MASLHSKRGWLYLDFRWRGVRCREATRLRDTPEHRSQVRRLGRQIDGEIAADTFDYRKWFPQGRRGALFAPPIDAGPPKYEDYVLRWLEDTTARLAAGTAYDRHRRYFTIAFFSGLRPSEQIGLRWDDLDWQRKLIGVRRARTRWGEGVTKTVAASREVHMLPAVERELRAQRAGSQLRSPWMFPNTQGGPLNLTNLRERVWRPALRRAGLRYRAMYQTRHTFATLALASGEDIGWVAKMLGHTSTEMVIRRYHRFIPNLTRRDGWAVARLTEQYGF